MPFVSSHLKNILIDKVGQWKREGPFAEHKYRVGKSRLAVVRGRDTEVTLALLLINHCIVFPGSNCRPPFAPPHNVRAYR